MTVTWGEPPADGKWAAIAEELQSRPRHWARLDEVGRNPRAYVTHINRGRLSAFKPPGTFEAKVVRGQLWARYVGPTESEDSE